MTQAGGGGGGPQKTNTPKVLKPQNTYWGLGKGLWILSIRKILMLFPFFKALHILLEHNLKHGLVIAH